MIRYTFIIILFLFRCTTPDTKDKIEERASGSEIYHMDDNTHTRWSSFENPRAEKGEGAQDNEGAKGHAFERLKAGERKTLLDVDGSGVINRMWITIMQKDPATLRSVKIEMFWDGEEKPAVSVPFGDFFGNILGRIHAFENAFFSNPEGRSFNCVLMMPFKSGAKIEVVNDADYEVSHIFYDVNFSFQPWDENSLYFHAFWNHDTATALGFNFELLPEIEGAGKYLGAHIGIRTNPLYEGHWWGEGEVKVYLDGDSEYPTLVGTGTEDYIGTGWGQGEYINRYQGCTIAENGLWGFYRYHIPDPVFFHSDIKVTLQQIGGSSKENVIELYNKGVPMIPISIDARNADGSFGEFVKLLEMDPVPEPDDPSLPHGHMNYYRSDDVSSVTFFYLDAPVSKLPSIEPVELRIAGMESNSP